MTTTILPSARNAWDLIGAQIGQNISQNLPQGIQRGEEQSYAEKLMQMQQHLKNQQQGLLARVLGGEQLSPQEMSMIPGNEQIAAYKAMNKPPTGGTTSQPVPGEYSQKMRDIINANPKASSDDLKLAFDEAGIPPIHTNSLVENRRRMEEKEASHENEKYKSSRKESFEIVKPILKANDEARKNIPLQEKSIEDILEASDEVGAQDYFAEVTGFEPLRSAKGAQLKTAIKDFFLSDLSRAGTRPNQWIEKQLADALPKLGRSAIANKTVAEGMRFKVDLGKKRIEIVDRLADEDRSRYGFVQPDVDSRAMKEMKPYIEEREKELSERIKALQKEEDYKPQKKYVRMKAPDGLIWDILPENIEDAEKDGYTTAE